ncbi:hypothetical protein [Tannerella sp.]|uniref:hypothetical protein n=1 Tax=Tannerella sp. TaxID=2382127 RepID=UPI003FA27D27
MIKKTLFITFFLLSVCPCFLTAQDSWGPDFRKGRIGVSFSSFGKNTGLYLTNVDGSASYDNGGFFALGLNYTYPLNRWLDFETGVEYARHEITVVSAPISGERPADKKVMLSLIGIPLTFRANFLKYAFVNGGLQMDIDTSSGHDIDNQTGLGAMLGTGIKYDFKCGFSMFINPYMRMHALLPFAPRNLHLRICEGGVRIGVSANLSGGTK